MLTDRLPCLGLRRVAVEREDPVLVIRHRQHSDTNRDPTETVCVAWRTGARDTVAGSFDRRPGTEREPVRRGATAEPPGTVRRQRPRRSTPMKWNTRRIAAAVIVLPAVLGVAACGKSESPAPAAGQTQSSSAAATSDAPAAGQPYKDKASFVAAMKAAGKNATTAHVTMAMDAAGQKIAITGDTKVDANNPAMKMSMDMGSSMKLDMILVDKKVYMKGFPGLAAGKWAVIDSSSTMGKQLAQSLDQADPTKMYDQFGAAVTDVKYVGEDTVDGAKAYKYDLTLDTKAMQAKLGSQTTKMPDTITYTVWLDEQSHLRKVTFDLMGVKANMTMSKYGEPVDIQAPAAADTVKAPV